MTTIKSIVMSLMNEMPTDPDDSSAMIMIDHLVETDQWKIVDTLQELTEKVVQAVVGNKGFHKLGIEILKGSELSLVFTDDAGIREINRTHRGQDKPTNVLSFPQLPADAATYGPFLGDIIFAFETIEREAALDKKSISHHLMHLTVHGFLHLLGFDHEDDEDAEEMEALEIEILSDLNIPNPYRITSNDDQ